MVPFSNRVDFIGATSTLASACERASVASQTELPVLLLGERGVGKETFAREIVACSERADKTFVKLRCDLTTPRVWDALFIEDDKSTVDSTLELSSELNRALGSGVLYLDEIFATPRNVQRRLANALNADALKYRVLFGSSRSFADARRSGLITSELEPFLVAYPIGLPSLSERDPDFHELAELFLRTAARELGVWRRPLDERELEQARRMNTPENLDDLRRLMTLVAATDSFPREFDEFERSRTPSSELEPETDGSASDSAAARQWTRENFPSLDDAAKRHIEAALRLSNGVVEGKKGAAELLKINPYTLRARMRKLQLDWTLFRDSESSDSNE